MALIFHINSKKIIFLRLNLFKMKKTTILLSVISFLLTIAANGQTNNNIEVDEFVKKIGSERYMLIDVRTGEEFAEGHIKGAVNIDYYSTDFSHQIGKIENETPVLLYCRSGNRSGKSVQMMYEMGFTEVKHLDCGIKGWLAEGRKIIQSEDEN